MKVRLVEGLVWLAAGLLAVGCTSQAPSPPPSTHEDHNHAGHDHGSAGPHHGQLIELGTEEFHAELTHDDATHLVTIYILDSKAAAAVSIDTPQVMINLQTDTPRQFALLSKPQEGESEGMASRFELISEELCKALDDPTANGRLTLNIRGTPYSGKITGHAHAEHPHKH